MSQYTIVLEDVSSFDPEHPVTLITSLPPKVIEADSLDDAWSIAIKDYNQHNSTVQIADIKEGVWEPPPPPKESLNGKVDTGDTGEDRDKGGSSRHPTPTTGTSSVTSTSTPANTGASDARPRDKS